MNPLAEKYIGQYVGIGEHTGTIVDGYFPSDGSRWVWKVLCDDGQTREFPHVYALKRGDK